MESATALLVTQLPRLHLCHDEKLPLSMRSSHAGDVPSQSSACVVTDVSTVADVKHRTEFDAANAKATKTL